MTVTGTPALFVCTENLLQARCIDGPVEPVVDMFRRCLLDSLPNAVRDLLETAR